MAFFSTQKEHKINRSHSTERTERIKPSSTGLITSVPSFAASLPSTRTRSSSRPRTIHDPHPTDVYVQRLDSKPPTPKSITTSASRQSLRRIPVPYLPIQDLDKVPYDRPRTSPIPSSSSTSVSRKSSIADIGGAADATTSKAKPDHLNSLVDTRILIPPYYSPTRWESSSGSTRDLSGAYDLKSVPSPVSDLSIRISPSQQVITPMSSPRSGPQKPQRAVLRRKSNAKPPPKSQSIFPSLSHRKSKPDLGIRPATATPPRTIPSAHQSPRLVSTPPSLGAADRVRRSTNDEGKLRSPGNLSPLTPAGAVAAAYKEQEKWRTELVSAEPDGKHGDSCDEDGGAYYTVFGLSGKVVAIGAPEDESWSRCDLSNYTSNKPKTVPQKPSLGALGRLSRKSSTKTKKNVIGNTSGIASESESGHERITRDEVGRSSFQSRRSISVPSKQRSKRPSRISIDNSGVGAVSDSPQSPTTPSKSAGCPLDEPSPSTGGKIWKLMKRISTGALKDKYNAQEATPPVPALPEGLLSAPPTKSKTRSAPHSPDDSRLPMSRYIRGRSSFGDAPFSNRHRNTQGVPSPVSSHQPPALNGAKNPSHRRRSTNTRSSSPVSSDKASSKYWQKSRSSSVSTFEEMPPLPGRILASGPILSPLELSKLEKEQAMLERSLSSPPSTIDSHSSTASPPNHHGNAVIVIRKPSLRGTHTLTSGEDSETDGMSTSDFVALPTPPRHHYRPNPHVVYHQSNDSSPIPSSVSTSPTIPMFSTQEVVNKFHSAKGNGMGMSRSLNSSSVPQSTGVSSNEFGVVIPVRPPPRPQRSDKRKPLVVNQRPSVRVSHDRERDSLDHHHRRGVPPLAPASHLKERTVSAPSPSEDDDGDGRPHGTFGASQMKGLVELVKTSEDSSRENFRLSSSIHSKSSLKFREMGSGEGGKDKKVLTEKEKADRWDDLLERSDRAGGTIHIGNTKLLSDSLRFSDYSTLTTSAL